ncbi:hypothetical protein MS3_00006358 [Schistosoma haematobium]|uniref:Reverse transcriptase domain-containing protein n=1 Tax=Schistosoma haematobium TaxID=6185 RepID=A0A922LHI8_SCHHA|nr:hypothetical protein MS3_00000252 [Schistosoma haematobium]XP_051067666.1 hypothetical protein MS3_00006358 [Schistosoma haematobium]KAH9584928.1 hypothetical protein MS3_00000252 [Schistosoma haematobium]KAH9584929.1 hypothetical protein MS3_00006358 [Schistosoma haematobium]
MFEVTSMSDCSSSRQLLRLVKDTGIMNPTFSETISGKDGHIIHSQSRRLDRWAEHFRDHFNWPSATLRFPSIYIRPEWHVDVGPPTLNEVEKAIGNLKRGRAAVPDRFTSEVFKDGSPVLAVRLTKVLGRIWELDVIPSDWSQSLIVSVYKKAQKSSCNSHRGISLTNAVYKILALIILRRLTKARAEQTRENQASFRLGRGCIDQIIPIRQVLEHRRTFRRSTIVVFFDLRRRLTLLLRQAMFYGVGVGWKKARGDQTKTCHKYVN